MKIITGILIFIILPNILLGQVIRETELNDLRNVIHNDMKDSDAPGAVFLIAKNGEIIFEEAFGVCNLNTMVPVNSSTAFQIASVTKVFTAAALLIACEKNNIDIDSPIGDFIEGLSPGLSKVTIHQLLSHTSGIIEWPNENECKNSLAEYVLNTNDDVFFEEPGKVFSYSNSGYSIAGLVLSKINNTSYVKAIEDILINPLEMTRSTFDLPKVTTNFFASGHVNGNVRPPRFQNESSKPCGGLYSTARDLSKFANCFMDDGNYNGKEIISENVIQKMSGKYIPFGVQYQYLGYPNSFYGYGLVNFNYGGINFIGHSGETGDQSSLLVMAPNYNTAIIVMSNTGYYPFINSVEKAISLILTVNENDQKDSKVFKLKDIEGKYYTKKLDDKKRYIEIKKMNGIWTINFSGGKAFELKQIGNYHYQFNNPQFKFPPEIVFFEDEKGDIKYLNYLGRTSVKL